MGTMENKNPTVAVVVATYNGATYLRAQLESIVQQTYKPS
jgi:glycosyltransferase involved in cell wall biosynthesis